MLFSKKAIETVKTDKRGITSDEIGPSILRSAEAESDASIMKNGRICDRSG